MSRSRHLAPAILNWSRRILKDQSFRQWLRDLVQLEFSSKKSGLKDAGVFI
jgi:hypothetical protein